MPLYIDPAWEYWQPDQEVAELLAESGACVGGGFAAIADRRLGKAGGLGFRFGKGKPDFFCGRLAPRKRAGEREALRHRECAACGDYFLPKRSCRPYCSRKCSPHVGAQRSLPDVTCALCGIVFRRAEAGRKYCSLACVGKSQHKQAPPSGCKGCGGHVPPSSSRNAGAVARLFCSKKCKAAAANRKRRARKREAS